MIYIALHKKVEIPPMEKYIPIHVGADLGETWDILGDNTGENISSKNKDFCELTGLYWIWKNTNDKYKGIVHYRRYFAKSNLKSKFSIVYSYNELRQMLEEVDIVLPYVEFFKINAKDELLIQCCNMQIFEILKSIINIKYPKYIETFNSFFSSNNATLFNMMFCSGKIFDQYCTWLFDILFELEEQIKYKNVPYPARLYGYLAERLMNVWVINNHLTVKHVGVLNTEMKLNKRIQLIRRRITNRIRFTLKRV